MGFPQPTRTPGTWVQRETVEANGNVTRLGRVVGTVKVVEGKFVATPARGITPVGKFESQLPALKHLIHADCLQLIHELEKLSDG